MFSPQTKTTPVALTLSPTNDSFAILSLPDLRLTTFTFLTGRLHRAYDESLTAVQEMQQAGTSGVALDSMEFGRRLAVERELEKLSLDAVKEGIVGSSASIGQPVWDESGKFVLYPTLLGIKGELSLRARLRLSEKHADEPCHQSSTRSPTRLRASSERMRLSASPTLHCTKARRRRRASPRS